MIIDGTYKVTVVAGGKTYSGTAEVATRGEAMRITLNAPIVGKVKAEGTVDENGAFTAEGSLRVLLKRITYAIDGQVEGDAFTATARTNVGTYTANGKRI